MKDDMLGIQCFCETSAVWIGPCFVILGQCTLTPGVTRKALNSKVIYRNRFCTESLIEIVQSRGQKLFKFYFK